MTNRTAEAPERTLREWADGWATSGDSPMVNAMRAAADEIDRLREQAEGLRAERDALRAALEELFPAEEGFTEAFDILEAKGLLTEVPADEHFRAEYDEDNMFVWTWFAARYRGGDDGR